MATFSRASFLKMTAATVATGFLAACSTGSNDSSSSATSSSNAEYSEPVTFESEFGTTKLESVPQKIAVVNYWKNSDVLLALGVVPAGMPKVTYGQNSNDSYDWTDAKIKELGGTEPVKYDETEAPDYEALAKLEPDVIFSVYSSLDQETYDKLTKIAPVVTYPKETGAYAASWQEITEIAGKMLNKLDDAKKLIEDTEKAISDKVAEYDNLKGSTFIAGAFNTEENNFASYLSTDSRSQFFTQIGMSLAQAAVDAEKNASSAYSATISGEVLNTVEADVVWAWANSDDDVTAIKKNSLFAQMPALKNNATVFVTDAQTTMALSAASPLSVLWYVNETDQLKQISDAVANTKNAG